MQSTCLKKQGDTWSDRGITSCSSSPCQINGVFLGEGSAAVSGRRSRSLIEGLPRILWLCCAASPDAADGGNGFSRGRYTKLQQPQTGAGQTLLLTSGISFLPFRFLFSSLSFRLRAESIIVQLNIDIRLSCAWSYFTTHHIVPLRCWLDPSLNPRYGFTGCCAHEAIIIMEAVTGNLCAAVATLCLIVPSSAVALTGPLAHCFYKVDNVTGNPKHALARLGRLCCSYFFHFTSQKMYFFGLSLAEIITYPAVWLGHLSICSTNQLKIWYKRNQKGGFWPNNQHGMWTSCLIK